MFPLGASLAAAALDRLFEHPAVSSAFIANFLIAKPLPDKDAFFHFGFDHSINARVQQFPQDGRVLRPRLQPHGLKIPSRQYRLHGPVLHIGHKPSFQQAQSHSLDAGVAALQGVEQVLRRRNFLEGERSVTVVLSLVR